MQMSNEGVRETFIQSINDEIDVSEVLYAQTKEINKVVCGSNLSKSMISGHAKTEFIIYGLISTISFQDLEQYGSECRACVRICRIISLIEKKVVHLTLPTTTG